MKLRQEINIIILVNHFEKGAKKKKNHLQQFKPTGENERVPHEREINVKIEAA